MQGYSSPAILLQQIDSGMNVDLLKEDLFSMGVIALQLLNLDIDVKSIYKNKSKTFQNARVDFGLVATRIQ